MGLPVNSVSQKKILDHLKIRHPSRTRVGRSSGETIWGDRYSGDP